eukprot:2312283-Rhodomonas_salina.1
MLEEKGEERMGDREEGAAEEAGEEMQGKGGFEVENGGPGAGEGGEHGSGDAMGWTLAPKSRNQTQETAFSV